MTMFAAKATLYLSGVFALVISLCGHAQTAVNAHNGHQRIGYHGMVVFTDNTHVYACHLPLYRAPHDYQIVYKLETAYQQQLVNYLNSQARTDGEAVVTLLPERFDLNVLVEAQETPTLKTQFFKGHFERGGEKWLLDNSVHFATPIIVEALVVADTPSQTWWHAPLGSTSAGATDTSLHLYTHKIDSQPSYDALVIGKNCEGGPLASLTSMPETATDVLALFTHCEAAVMQYFDTQDFQ